MHPVRRHMRERKRKEKNMNGIMNEMLGSNGLDERRATADLAWAFLMNSPLRGTMAHKVKFWKEGHARRKLGNSSPARTITDVDLDCCYHSLLFVCLYRSFCVACRCCIQLQHLLHFASFFLPADA